LQEALQGVYGFDMTLTKFQRDVEKFRLAILSVCSIAIAVYLFHQAIFVIPTFMGGFGSFVLEIAGAYFLILSIMGFRSVIE
jgi:hypothetical protein